MRILVVDDNATNLEVAEQMLDTAGYTSVTSSRDPEEAVTLCGLTCPDLLMLDLHMPGLDGFGVMVRLRDLIREPEALPILVVTADTTPETRRRALSLGARDFVTKPLDQTEVLLRVRNLLQTRSLQLVLQQHNDQLTDQVQERTASLEQARLETLERLALVAEYRDHPTYEHAQRIGRTAEALARQLGLPTDQAQLIRRAAPLHDIGKIGIPDEVLLKPGPFTEAEWAIVKTHAVIGAQILSGGSCPILQLAEEIARCHHERHDGTGYPQQLAGEAIPLAARLVAVADVFDALMHERPYKKAWPIEEARRVIQENAGKHFDPIVVAAFNRLELEALTAPVTGFTAHPGQPLAA